MPYSVRHARETRARIVESARKPGLNGVKVAEELRVSCPDCKVLALTVHEDRGYLRQLLEVGIAGYVLKWSAAGFHTALSMRSPLNSILSSKVSGCEDLIAV